MSFPNETIEYLFEIIKWQIEESKSLNVLMDIDERLKKSNLPLKTKKELFELLENKKFELKKKAIAFVSFYGRNK